MAQMCHTCTRATPVIHCLTEGQNLCFTCDYLQHCDQRDAAGEGAGEVRHVRYQICDSCMNNPALLLCFDHRLSLCQSCYSQRYNCASYGHRNQILSSLPHQQQHHNNHNNQHPRPQHPEQEHRLGHNDQIRRLMFGPICVGDNDCERWMFAMDCEECKASNAVVYCYQHDSLLCDNCDRVNHPFLPHVRARLCVTCKRPSRFYHIGYVNVMIIPPYHPPAAPAA
ncbi:unnamed protein product [Microthlaspi erraticum]|uniref:B box-type domain-containing protein n=1 Tax=Microthlaspi erraticum TaxID=1685480 RepID=A0A6D2HA51_9BRAS|nr:unnamed protein product [Microthlaspi erraticum]